MQIQRVQNNNYNTSFGIKPQQKSVIQLLDESRKIALDSLTQMQAKLGCENKFVAEGKKVADSKIDSGNVDLQQLTMEVDKKYSQYFRTQELLNRQRESDYQINKIGIGF